jgi:ribonuclease VapC
MFVDASALVAMLVSEDEAPSLFTRLEAAETRLTSAMAVWEASVAVSRILHRSVKAAEGEVNALLRLLEIESVAVPASIASGALDAFDRYGKGRHRAQLNFGDCFAYACARHFGQPLLFKGNDFSLTDIEAA